MLRAYHFSRPWITIMPRWILRSTVPVVDHASDSKDPLESRLRSDWIAVGPSIFRDSLALSFTLYHYYRQHTRSHTHTYGITPDVTAALFGRLLFHLLSHAFGCLTITLYVTRREDSRTFMVSIRKVRGFVRVVQRPRAVDRKQGRPALYSRAPQGKNSRLTSTRCDAISKHYLYSFSSFVRE